MKEQELKEQQHQFYASTLHLIYNLHWLENITHKSGLTLLLYLFYMGVILLPLGN